MAGSKSVLEYLTEKNGALAMNPPFKNLTNAIL
jgi:hypothetical protein